MTAYYNEYDSGKAELLREAMKEGLIAPGDVDERSIERVEADDLAGYTQCHFFAGIGAWSFAARLAGWPDDRSLWTGSPPCPTFSKAGQGGGFNDPRHLWPHWKRLIHERQPSRIFGEQASDSIGYGWIDAVQSDLEGEGYAVGKAVLGACSVGAPHIRQRLYFVADAEWRRRKQRYSQQWLIPEFAAHRSTRRVDDAIVPGLERLSGHGDNGDQPGWFGADQAGPVAEDGVIGGFWADAEWIPCRTEVPGAIEWRPIKPGTFVLANGTTGRVFSLRCAGDAIVPQVAAAFIESYCGIES